MSDVKLLRIYTDEAAFHGDRKVFEEVASRRADARLAGATVLQALIGFGRSAHLHRPHVLEEDLSLVIEIVDREDRLRGFVSSIADIGGIGDHARARRSAARHAGDRRLTGPGRGAAPNRAATWPFLPEARPR